MNELMIIIYCVWYVFMGFGTSKLLESSKLSISEGFPMFFVILGWWLIVPVCALCKEEVKR